MKNVLATIFTLSFLISLLGSPFTVSASGFLNNEKLQVSIGCQGPCTPLHFYVERPCEDGCLEKSDNYTAPHCLSSLMTQKNFTHKHGCEPIDAEVNTENPIKPKDEPIIEQHKELLTIQKKE